MDKNTPLERVKRYSHSSTTLVSLATKYLLSNDISAQDLSHRLGQLKGPLMKIGQLLAMVPGLIPPVYEQALLSLNAQAPPMGPLFVKRRMKGELGPYWEDCFSHFDYHPFAAASIGQVHRAISLDQQLLACKLQYPNMAGIIEADLKQFNILKSLYETRPHGLDLDQFLEEIKSHLYKEISYHEEAKHIQIFQNIFSSFDTVIVPRVISPLSTDRLLTMSYLKGDSLDGICTMSQSIKNTAAHNLFFAWYHPFYRHGYLHGDPHAGNYLFSKEGHVSLLDFGCVREFPPSFIKAVYTLYNGLQNNNKDLLVCAYEGWGFKNLNLKTIDSLTSWAGLFYGPLLEDKSISLADRYNTEDIKQMGREVLTSFKQQGALEIPREFVLMHRVAVGMGSAFIKLGAQLNWHRLFETLLDQAGFSRKH
ncbi:MAG: ABC1 kinase family protein [Alphaproteobacteria bacterium]